MKAAARTFLILDLVATILCFGFGIFMVLKGGIFVKSNLTEFLMYFLPIFGANGIITSIGGLVAISRKSLAAVKVWGALNFTTDFIVAIIMLCMHEEDLLK